MGLKTQDLVEAKDFINLNVLDRQCFLLVKDGKIAYEWYNASAPDPPHAANWTGAPKDKPHRGWSMTKTVGGFLTLLAATEDGLDIDADITHKYRTPSPKPYGVTLRMMMSQVIGGDERPGQIWRYDEMGDMWLHLFPQVILQATGHNASYYMDRLRSLLGLSSSFTWPTVNTEWYKGASGSCRDWARFGQLILNGGMWSGKQLIASKYIDQMQQPVKYEPYNSYTNPCYGLLVWLNADKSKHPGCCWEASRLPEPKCNQETFMDGAVHDLTLNIGLYGQIVMTLGSANAVVVGFGRDLRPIEPARIGYYPGVCKALGIPCNTPSPVPATKCGESLQCSGVAAQCFSGGGWSHEEPYSGKDQCVSCFQNRLPIYMMKFPEAHDMIKNNCPTSEKAEMDFIACYCGLTGKNANPFHPWPSTTTTTPKPSPAPPLPPPGPTPAPPAPGPVCGLPEHCIFGMQQKFACLPIAHNGGHNCYKALRVHQRTLSASYGCPAFFDDNFPIIESKAFCYCGLDSSVSPSSVTTGSLSLLPLLERYMNRSLMHEYTDEREEDEQKALVPKAVESRGKARTLLSYRSTGPRGHSRRLGKACINKHDGGQLKKRGEGGVESDMQACANKYEKGPVNTWAQCMASRDHLGGDCAHCFGRNIQCIQDHCLELCACGETAACHACETNNCCMKMFDCSGIGQQRRRACRRRVPVSIYADSTYTADSIIDAESQNVAEPGMSAIGYELV